MGEIIVLSEDVSHKIAAGEVIEGPFSVVRELLDNSIDADAREIRIVINNGGKDYILVRDNGLGMDEKDALLSIQKHSTSKIRKAEDLSHIRTLGFRGEALSSICRVSEFEMITARRGDSSGTVVRCSFGRDFYSGPCPANPGTEIRVRNLFFNLPARRKFLKSNRAEFLRVKSEIIKKAIPFYFVGFQFLSDDKPVLNLLPAEEISGRLGQIFGNDLIDSLIIFHTEGDGFKVAGYFTSRNFTLSNRRFQYIFVNNRYIEDKSIIYIINEATKGFYPPSRYPACFLFVDILPEMIDVNIHPTKREIRFKKQKEIVRYIYESIRNSFYTRITFRKDNVRRGVGSALAEESFSGSSRRSLSIKNGDNRLNLTNNSKGKIQSTNFTRDSTLSADSCIYRSDIGSGERDLHVGSNIEKYLEKNSAKIEKFGIPEFVKEKLVFNKTDVSKKRSWEMKTTFKNHVFSIPDLSVLDPDKTYFKGSLFNKFLIFETGKSMYLVDQHAAHERVLFEKLEKDAISQGRPYKALLFPVVITPPEDIYGIIEDNMEEFREAGFEINLFGEGSFKLDSIPGYVPEKWESVVVSEFFDTVFKTGFTPDAQEIRKRFIAITACKMAVKEGNPLGEKEANELLRDLLRTSNPLNCPHGRPTVLVLSEGTLDRLFYRK